MIKVLGFSYYDHIEVKINDKKNMEVKIL